MKKLCIYHANCADGFTAAWIVRNFFGEANVEFIPATHGDDIPDVEDREIILVDFCYPPAQLKMLEGRNKSILVIDHHQTSEAWLETYPDVDDLFDAFWDGGYTLYEYYNKIDKPCKIYKYFDKERSGAGLAWDFFFGGERPDIVTHVEDRDLWKFEITNTEDFQANMFSYDYTFKNWDQIHEDCTSGPGYSRMCCDGAAIVRNQSKSIQELIKSSVHDLNIGGYAVPALNVPYFWGSEAGNYLCELMQDVYPFAACYYRSSDSWKISLRSVGDFDVAKVAEMYGGGGHKNASGFSVKSLNDLVLSSEDVILDRLHKKIDELKDINESLTRELKDLAYTYQKKIS